MAQQMDFQEALQVVQKLIQETIDGPHETAAKEELKKLYDTDPSVQKIVDQLTNIEELKGPKLTVVEEIQKEIITPTPKLRAPTPAAVTPAPKPLLPLYTDIPGYSQFNQGLINLRNDYKNPQVKLFLNAIIASETQQIAGKEIQQHLAGGGQLNLLAATNLAPVLNHLAGSVQSSIEGTLNGANKDEDKVALGNMNEHLSELSRASTTVRAFVSNAIKDVVTPVGLKFPAVGRVTPLPITPKKS